ncbi:HD-GYP domain-containing protein [Vogesella sp. LIG4]|uniref:HD-GYP domain-containing protein n=1 Tax=Vogesella sp. LIG4 TaxID=1192162 RepID=UPI00081FF10C|nr:HD domain-containing phosphohydrolase [Vogesella sp. LIG4]SCK30266.1 HD-GYP domain, c-di-GMP phosphodiesterase class II (or its inactivated variant) [Vogesella sp. LIG4]
MAKPDNAPVLNQAFRVGEALQENVYTRNGLLLLKKGHYVLSESQRERLVRMGVTVPGGHMAPVESDLARIGDFSPFEEVQHAARHLDYLLGAGLSSQGFEQRVRALANRLAAFTQRAPDGMLAAVLLVPVNKYAAAHSVHVVIILTMLAGKLDLPPEVKNSLLCAALTMNLSIASLMDNLHHQRKPLSDEQKQQIEAHPLLSSAMLRELNVHDELWHQLVQTHHEQWNGSGYPYGLGREHIETLSHLLHLADVTAAKLAPRGYRAALKPNKALASVFLEADKSFDHHLTSLLVKELGIYPPGCFVRLANQEMGVVLQRRNRANAPCVAALRSNDGASYSKPQLREASKSQYKIMHALDQQQIGIRPQYLASLWKRQRITPLLPHDQ